MAIPGVKYGGGGSGQVLQRSASSAVKKNGVGQDPNKTVGYIMGRPVNYGGDFLDGGAPAVLGESTSSTPAYDPEAARRSALQSGFDSQKSNIYGTARDAASIAGRKIGGSITDFIGDLRSGQRGIDEQGIQAMLAKKQGYNSINDMVGQGIRSGNLMLGNNNAGDSSAAQAIAEAYGQIGRKELSGVGNEYAQKERENQLAQEQLLEQQQAGIGRIQGSKQDMIDNIVLEARNKLAELDAAIVDADLPTRIAIEQERNAIKSEVTGMLSKFDSQLTQGVKGIKAKSAEQRQAEAYQLANEGVAADQAFNFSTEIPQQFQGTGPSAGGLPLFSLPRNSEEQLG